MRQRWPDLRDLAPTEVRKLAGGTPGGSGDMAVVRPRGLASGDLGWASTSIGTRGVGTLGITPREGVHVHTHWLSARGLRAMHPAGDGRGARKARTVTARRRLVRPRQRTVPGTFAETVFGRWWWWASAIGVTLLALVATYAVFVDGLPYQHATLIASGVALFFWSLVAWVAVYLLWRPRHTPTSLNEAALKRMGQGHGSVGTNVKGGGPPEEHGVFIPGSSRISAATCGAALSWAAMCTMFAIAAEGGWRIVWVVCTALLILVVVNNAVNIRPRWLFLTPERIYVSGSRATSSLRWDDIGRIAFEQGHDGLMIHRIYPIPGASPTVTRRRPLARRPRKAIDLEGAAFNLDLLLLHDALLEYWGVPKARAELEGPAVPERFTDPSIAYSGIDIEKDLRSFRPERRSH